MLKTPELTQMILNANRFVLTTHKNSDGDGLGSVAALYWALASLGKDVHFLHIDIIPPRYSFLLEGLKQEHFETSNLETLTASDLLIIVDTHQGDLCNPLFDSACKAGKHVLFMDHHLTQKTNQKNCHYFVDSNAASTGEIIYDLLERLNVTVTKQIAKCIYASLTFDTQAFKLTRNSYRSHLIASELVKYEINTEQIQRALFANWTIEKMSFLSVLITNTQKFNRGTVVGMKIMQADLDRYALEGDDVNDLLDLFTLIKKVQFCYCIREIDSEHYKISFRSVGNNQAFEVAELFQGGGHGTSAGAWVKSDLKSIESRIINYLKLQAA